jgi:2-dehydro-3-deoxyphosphooctonate aldolase (KDO 8-P synthase)
VDGIADMKIGGVRIGPGAPWVLISGLNVLESEAAAIRCASALAELAQRHDVPLVFKASFDKANRTHLGAHRGPGLDSGLEILARVKAETGLPLLTDVHDVGQVEAAAEVVDCLQVPAFLVRQTDLIAACAATGRAINFKRGPFVAPTDMRHAVAKAVGLGARDVLVTERGTSFGYNDLVADMRGLVAMREFVPVCFDATHAVQRPGASSGASGGDRSMVAPLARAAVATGVDALFIETHPDPDEAPCDSACQITLGALDRLVGEAVAIRGALDATTAQVTSEE